MTNKEKLKNLKELPAVDVCNHYYNLLESFGDLKYHYYDYLISEPMNCNEELKRVDNADYDLCCALLTMLLREDHFEEYGCFEHRFENGDVQKIVDRMIYLLESIT